METEIKILRWKQYICTTSNFKLQLANANNVYRSGIAWSMSFFSMKLATVKAVLTSYALVEQSYITHIDQ